MKLLGNINMNNSGRGNINNDDNESMAREQDRCMPVANVTRIMRKALPPQAKIAEDAKETIQQCATEFVRFITGEANDRCQGDHRKTVTAEDILWAMSRLGFEEYLEPLTLYLNRYRELEGDRGVMMKKVVQVVNDPNGGLNMVAPSTHGPLIGGFTYEPNHQGKSIGFYPQNNQGGSSGFYPQNNMGGSVGFYPQNNQGGSGGFYPQNNQGGSGGFYPQNHQGGSSGFYPQNNQGGSAGFYPQNHQGGYDGFDYPQNHQGGYDGFDYPQMGGGGYVEDAPNLASSSSQVVSGVDHHSHYPNNF